MTVTALRIGSCFAPVAVLQAVATLVEGWWRQPEGSLVKDTTPNAPRGVRFEGLSKIPPLAFTFWAFTNCG